MFAASILLLHLATRAAAPRLASIAPRAARQLPPAIRATLTARRCRIPESGARGDPWQNAARGHFTAPHSDDWAVLCLAHGTTRIFVFRQGSSDVFAELADHPLTPNLTGETQPDGTRIFNRLLSTASPAAIRGYFAYRGDPPPPLSHDGIDDADGKSSTVWYYLRGRWLQCQGGD